MNPYREKAQAKIEVLRTAGRDREANLIQAGLNRIYCLDCGLDVLTPKYGYSLKDDLWREQVGRPGYLCWDCMEKRMGRSLALSDFKRRPGGQDYHVNLDNPRFRALLRGGCGGLGNGHTG